MKTHTCCWLAILFLLLGGAGCATRLSWVKYEVYFGLTSDSGRIKITAAQWQQFQDEEILSRFPDGFTIHHVDGHWHSDGKPYAEPSVILDVVAPCNRDSEDKVTAIAREYAQRFRQDAVLLTKTPVDVDFLNSSEHNESGL
jgi:hypothetical protein